MMMMGIGIPISQSKSERMVPSLKVFVTTPSGSKMFRTYVCKTRLGIAPHDFAGH